MCLLGTHVTTIFQCIGQCNLFTSVTSMLSCNAAHSKLKRTPPTHTVL